MTDNHKNLTREDFEFEDYDAYLDDVLDRFFDRGDDYLSTVDHDFPFVYDAQRLYEHGRFGLLLNVIDNQPTRAKWTHMKDADCIRCGAENVGILGLMRASETPSGELYCIDQHSELCPDCADQVEQDFREHGAPQPTLTRGRWWTSGGETA